MLTICGTDAFGTGTEQAQAVRIDDRGQERHGRDPDDHDGVPPGQTPRVQEFAGAEQSYDGNTKDTLDVDVRPQRDEQRRPAQGSPALGDTGSFHQVRARRESQEREHVRPGQGARLDNQPAEDAGRGGRAK